MAKSPPPDEPLSRKDVRALIRLIRQNKIQEFELEQGDLKLRIVTSGPNRTESKNDTAPGVAAYPNVVYQAPGILYPSAGPAYPPVGVAQAMAPAAGNPGTPLANVVEAPGAAPAVVAADEEDPNLKKITSPMVGTFYRAPAPDAKPYVDVGSRVEEESVMCIVEAMKLMNEIKAEMRGVVRRILVENGQPVEYGQTMFLIEPA